GKDHVYLVLYEQWFERCTQLGRRSVPPRAAVQGVVTEDHLPTGSGCGQGFLKPFHLGSVHVCRIQREELHQSLTLGERIVPVSAHAEFVVFEFGLRTVLRIVVTQRRVEPASVVQYALVWLLKLLRAVGAFAVGVYVIAAHDNGIERQLVVLRGHLAPDIVLSLVTRAAIADHGKGKANFQAPT